MSIASWTSPPASARTFPISCVIRSVSSALWSATSCAKRKRSSPRCGAGTSRQSSKAALAAATARSTSSGADFGKTPSVSPSAGLLDSKVSPEAASTHSPPMKFLNVRVPVVATDAMLVRRLGLGEGARDAGAPPVADDSFAAVRLPGPPVRPLAAVDDHGDVRIVLVVLDHLVEQLRLELARDHAVDHRRLSVGMNAASARCARCPGRAGRPLRRA